MILNLGGKEYELKFGFDFLEYLNATNSFEMEFGEQSLSSGIGGSALLTMGLAQKQPTALYKTIKAGTAHLSQKPSNKDIEAYINEVADWEDDEYNLIFDEIEQELKKQPATRREMGIIK